MRVFFLVASFEQPTSSRGTNKRTHIKCDDETPPYTYLLFQNIRIYFASRNYYILVFAIST